MINFKDLVIVAVCAFVFAATVTLTAEKEHRHSQAGHPPPGGPPIAKIAQALDVPADRVRNAFDKVGPPSSSPLQPPSEQQLAEHSEKLATVLHVSATRVRTVMETYKPLERRE